MVLQMPGVNKKKPRKFRGFISVALTLHLSHLQNSAIEMIPQNKFCRAIVVREPFPGKKVFHKYNSVLKADDKRAIFQRNMIKLDGSRGQVIHINYYDKDNGIFLYQFRPL